MLSTRPAAAILQPHPSILCTYVSTKLREPIPEPQDSNGGKKAYKETHTLRVSYQRDRRLSSMVLDWDFSLLFFPRFQKPPAKIANCGLPSTIGTGLKFPVRK